ncbi:MAG: DMT family transporter [Clostridia bacterium]|nr:DMT family transporter [Clostridia bacterium]
MTKERTLNLIGQALLLTATIAWGTSFFILKETISEVPTFYVIAIRFMVAAAGLSLIFVKKLKTLKKETFLRGMLLGTLLALAYFSQTIGLENTTPGRNAFLTSSYCVMCPFIMWMLFKKKPKFYNVLSAVLCIVGIGLIALSGNNGTGENVLLGDGLTLVSAVFFGFQIIYIDKFSRGGHDTIQLLIPEILTAGVIMTIYTLAVELPLNGISAFSLNTDQIIKIGYLTVVCTLFAQSAQIIGQRFTSANQSSIILSLESVFGTLFSVLFANEKLSLMIIIGFVVVFIAMLITELKLDPMKLILRKRIKNFDTKAVDNGDKI